MGKHLVNFNPSIFHNFSVSAILEDTGHCQNMSIVDTGRFWKILVIPVLQILVNFIICGCESVHPFRNLQSRVRTHAVLVIGLYELLGNQTTYVIEPPNRNKWTGKFR
jgi:hypothetical protein